MPDVVRLLGPEAAARRAWSCVRDGTQLAIEDGPLDGAARPKIKALATDDAATVAMAKLVRGKVAEGFYAHALAFEVAELADVRGELGVEVAHDDDRVIVFPGDVVIPHDLILDFRWGLLAQSSNDAQPFAGVLVRGNLTIDGALLNFEDDYGPFLEVHGDLSATAIATGGSQVHVRGALRTGTLVGVYNHGSVAVDGALHARVIASDHGVTASSIDALRYHDHASKGLPVRGGVEDSHDPYDATGVFVAGVRSSDGVDLRKARTAIAAGKPIVQPELTSVRTAFRTLVAGKLAEPDKVKRLSLASKDFASLPDEAFAFRKLAKLDLSHNKLRTLPEAIGELTELTELDVRGNGLVRLPDSIGKLTKLRQLNLSSNCVCELPDSLAECRELRSLNLSNNPYSYVRLAFGGWRHVRILWELPEVLTRLPRLEELVIDGALIRSLPRRRFDSPALRRAELKSTLILDVDPALHDQLSVDTSRSRERAADYVRYWFSRDHVQLETFYDLRTAQFDFAEVTAMLGLLVEIAIPTAAPYDAALAQWDAQIAEVVRGITWDGKYIEQVRALFAALGAALAPLVARFGDNALIDGLRTRFAARA